MGRDQSADTFFDHPNFIFSSAICFECTAWSHSLNDATVKTPLMDRSSQEFTRTITVHPIHWAAQRAQTSIDLGLFAMGSAKVRLRTVTSLDSLMRRIHVSCIPADLTSASSTMSGTDSSWSGSGSSCSTAAGKASAFGASGPTGCWPWSSRCWGCWSSPGCWFWGSLDKIGSSRPGRGWSSSSSWSGRCSKGFSFLFAGYV